ncbi:GntR family transcriptional regulator [Nitratireductor sp. CH_MIT9313-5]|uniref:GntR family transcriptional regulator n=1 Tax=Nitratireductor sp. CH_MIT9313-5 TaxID=3107764 RepID=UPI003008045D
MEYKPLYTQIRDQLVRRLVEGEWSPGMLIPSEMELARQMGVSQGTVRKALDTMTAENLLIRRQGKGTFVAQPEDSRILFQFFRLVPDDGQPVFPRSEVLSREASKASEEEAAALGIDAGDPVWRIERLRHLAEERVLVETIVLPTERFPDFPEAQDMPNNIYQLFSARWRITIAQAEERIKAVAASGADAKLLGCAENWPLLRIHRVAKDLENKPVELRVSRCLTDNIHYSVNLR